MEITAVINEADAGRMIKYFVRGSLHVSYHSFSVLKNTGGMIVNGNIVHANYLLQLGDIVTIRVPEAAAAHSKSVSLEYLPVDIVYEDDDLMVIDKPAPLPTQCSERNPFGTLENRIAALYPDAPFRPLNRLDKGTSGLMCAAKHAHACQLLQKQLHTDDFVRKYQAVVEGVLTGSGTIDLPIAKEPAATVRRIIDPVNGKKAVTQYESIYTNGSRSVVELLLSTGRTHQIRVHLSSLGCPVCGDFLYGTELPELPGRFALHSSYIRFRHPMNDRVIELESSLPEALRSLCRI